MNELSMWPGSGAALAAVVGRVPAADVPALALFLEMAGPVEVDQVLERWEEIEAALAALERQVGAAREVGRRCLGLRPRPASVTPPGI